MTRAPSVARLTLLLLAKPIITHTHRPRRVCVCVCVYTLDSRVLIFVLFFGGAFFSRFAKKSRCAQALPHFQIGRDDKEKLGQGGDCGVFNEGERLQKWRLFIIIFFPIFSKSVWRSRPRAPSSSFHTARWPKAKRSAKRNRLMKARASEKCAHHVALTRRGGRGRQGCTGG